MSYDVIAIHGAGEPRLRDGRIYWEPLLESGLGADFRVHAPRMPEPEDPHHEPWARAIAGLIVETDRPLLVGHSFGASTLLKYLAGADPRPRLRGLFLAATPFWNRDFPEYALTQGEIARLQRVSPLFFYQSRDDEEVPFDHLAKFAAALPHATVRELDGRGHEFDQPSFPEMVADIRGCVGSSAPP
jgi:predicted alpha/beta hydrolase family esterase